MPIDFEFDASICLVTITACGSVGDEEMLEFTQRIAAETALPRDCNKYVDLCGLTEATVSPTVIRRAADLLASSAVGTGTGCVALVAGRDFAYGLARMYQSYRSMAPERLRVFRERRDALDWLGVDKLDEP